jgi:hypothetical protein
MKMGLSHNLHDSEQSSHEPYLPGSAYVWQIVRHGPGRQRALCFGPTLPSSHTADRYAQA